MIKFTRKRMTWHMHTTSVQFTAWKLSKCKYFWSVFCRTRPEYKDLRSKSPYSTRVRENTDGKNSVFGQFSRSGSDHNQTPNASSNMQRIAYSSSLTSCKKLERLINVWNNFCLQEIRIFYGKWEHKRTFCDCKLSKKGI